MYYYDAGFLEMILEILYGVILLLIIAALVVPIVIGVLVYRDAKKRVDCSPLLFALLAAMAPVFIGLIAYLKFRKEYPLKPEYGGPARYDPYRTHGGEYELRQTRDGGEQAYGGEQTYSGEQTYGGGKACEEGGFNGSPQDQGEDSGESPYSGGQYTYYASTAPIRKSLPAWAKILIVIGVILVAFLAVRFVVLLIASIISTGTGHGSYGGNGLHF